MSWTPPPRNRPNDVTVTPWGDLMHTLSFGLVTTPLSGSWGSANRSVFIPLSLPEPFTVAKAFWCNGATVGTDSLDLGVYQMTDQTTGRLDLIRSTGAVLSAGTVNAVQEASAWKVARVSLTSSSDSTDATTYATASVTLKAGRLYLMSVENSHGTSATAVSAITGGPTFTSRASTLFNTNLNRISLWSAVPTADYTGTLTIAFSGTTQTGACWALTEMSGVDTTTNDGVVQTAVGTGSSNTSLATLAAFASANNATFGAQGHASASATAPGAGFTELDDVTAATPAQGLETEWSVANDTTVDSTITSAAWGAIAAEINADTSAFVIPACGPGLSNIYMGMVANGTTATIFRVLVSITNLSMAGVLGGTTFPLPSSLIPVAPVLTYNRPLAGFSSRSLIG